jgi:hypothetical protein
MDTQNRPKTNSITHLVKIVAEEVVQAALENRHAQIDEARMRAAMDDAAGRIVKDEVAPLKTMMRLLNMRLLNLECGGDIPDLGEVSDQWECHMAGCYWDEHEEGDLLKEFDRAVKWIAAQHGRTDVAIRCRLTDLRKQGRLIL